MITSKQCLLRYGAPELEKSMVLWDVPTELELGALPKRVYCNRDLVKPLEAAFSNIVRRGLAGQVKTWDGCFNIRRKKSNSTPSLHSWGLAIDINAAWNGYNKPVTMSKELVQCFKDAGFDWGGDWGLGKKGNWKGCDGMHFQLSKFPNE